MIGFWDDTGIRKQSAPRSRQITTPTPRQSIFTGRMLFPTPNQQCQSTEGRLSTASFKTSDMIVYNYDADLEVSDTCVRSSLLS